MSRCRVGSTSTTTFDGIASASCQPRPRGSASRRLTAETLGALRRRRTGPGRGLRKPLSSGSHNRHADSSESDDDDDDDDDDDTVTCSEVLCCCWGPRCCVASCMLMLTLMGWSAAITYGILKKPSYEQVVTPIRIARQRWLSKTPHTAEESFVLFDRNADGRVDVDDMAVVARLVTGENPTREELKAYIAKGDTDGNGALDEEEYRAMLLQERAAKHTGKRGGAGATTR